MSGRISAIAATHEAIGQNSLSLSAQPAAAFGNRKMAERPIKPVFDEQPVQSIGAIAIDPKNSKNVWVGTGESWTRNSVSIGNGIYRSTDGGETWTHVGLPNSERIAKIVGQSEQQRHGLTRRCRARLWSDSPDRGLYKTTDGGKTWNLILKGANLSTGVSDDRARSDESRQHVRRHVGFSPQRLDLSLRRRRSGGTVGSGLFRSTDGGATWTEITPENAKGFPKKPYGRIAVAIAPSNAKRVYAFVESPTARFLFPTMAARPGMQRDKSNWMVWRPFYFANLIVDPKNPGSHFQDRRRAYPERRRRARVLPRSAVSKARTAMCMTVWIDPHKSANGHRRG